MQVYPITKDTVILVDDSTNVVFTPAFKELIPLPQPPPRQHEPFDYFKFIYLVKFIGCIVVFIVVFGLIVFVIAYRHGTYSQTPPPPKNN